MRKSDYDIQLLKDPYRVEITTKLENHVINISDSVAKVLGLTTTSYELVTNQKLVLNVTPLYGLGPTIQYESKSYLWRNIYKDVSHLISDLNDAFNTMVTNIMWQQHRTAFINPPKLELDNKQVVKFITSENYKLKLESTMLNILHLKDTETDQKGTSPLVLSLPSCEYLFVNTDLISHFVNNEYSELLRVINNDAMNNHKSMQSFKKLQYYSIVKDAIHAIHIYITDRNGEILPFTSETTFLLHFRPSKS